MPLLRDQTPTMATHGRWEFSLYMISLLLLIFGEAICQFVCTNNSVYRNIVQCVGPIFLYALNPRHSRGRAHPQKRCRLAGFYLGISSSSKTLGGQVCSTSMQLRCLSIHWSGQAQEDIMSTLGRFPTTSTQPWQATGLILRPI